MILHDAYAMHRKWWKFDWVPGIGDESWTEWDFILADAYQVIDDFTDKSTGQYIPYDQSGEVHWDVKSQFSGSQAAIERAQTERELAAGETLYAVPTFDNPESKPTLSSWAKDMDEEKADGRPPEMRNSRPPTPEELANLLGAAKLE